jgi:hypothetical protein
MTSGIPVVTLIKTEIAVKGDFMGFRKCKLNYVEYLGKKN